MGRVLMDAPASECGHKPDRFRCHKSRPVGAGGHDRGTGDGIVLSELEIVEAGRTPIGKRGGALPSHDARQARALPPLLEEPGAAAELRLSLGPRTRDRAFRGFLQQTPQQKKTYKQKNSAKK